MKLAEIIKAKDYAVHKAGRKAGRGWTWTRYCERARTISKVKRRIKSRTHYGSSHTRYVWECLMLDANGNTRTSEAEPMPEPITSGAQVSKAGEPLIRAFEPKAFWGDWITWSEEKKRRDHESEAANRRRSAGVKLAGRLEAAMKVAFPAGDISARCLYGGPVNLQLDLEAAELLADEFESWAEEGGSDE